MACGYARASGGISACITTAGPGATNLVTGIANAYTDRQPILVITGETSSHNFGKGGLQESSGEGGAIDQNALFKGITRYNKIVERTDYLPQVLNQAAKILRSSNSGPVLLSFPYNVQKEMVDISILDSIKTTVRSGAMQERKTGVSTLVEYLAAARRPVIVGGYGCIKSGAQALVAQLSESMNIPVTTSLKGKGIISEQNPLSLGSLGVTSSGRAYRYIIDEADLVLFLGAGFNERTSYLWDDKLLDQKKVIQVDNDPGQLEKVFDADLAVQGDIKLVLSQLLDRLEDMDAVIKDWQSPADTDEQNAVEGPDTTHASFTQLGKSGEGRLLIMTWLVCLDSSHRRRLIPIDVMLLVHMIIGDASRYFRTG
jgi:acetolactate synthase-1/2/3 large subunit